MTMSTRYSEYSEAIERLIEDAQTDSDLQKALAHGTDDMKLKLLEENYGLSFDDLDAIYTELRQVFRERRFWFW